MNLIINTVGGQFLTLTPEMLQEKLGLKSDILSLGIEVSDGNTAITAQSYTKWECAGDTICPLIDVNVKNGSKATCIAYHGVNNITVKFEDGFVLYHARWNQFVRGALHHNQKNINE